MAKHQAQTQMLSQKMAFLLAAALLAVPLSAHAQADDDDDEGPAAKPAETTPAPAPEATPEAKPAAQPAQATPPAKSPEAAPSDEEEAKPAEKPKPVAAPTQGYLEGRAEAESPNEAIHTIEKKTYNAAGRFDATLYPLAIQLNSKFINTDGIALAVEYAVQENFALQLMGLWNYSGGWAPLTGELLDIHARPEAADQIILQGGAVAGFEVAPIYGKFAWYENNLAQFRFVLNAGAGVGFTEVQLSGPTNKFPTNNTSFGGTGPRFLGNLGVGFRILFSQRLALRLEVRDLLYTAKVDTINGCSNADITAIGTNGAVSSGCDKSDFAQSTSNSAAVNQQHLSAATVAANLLQDNSADVVNDIVFFAGLSFLF